MSTGTPAEPSACMDAHAWPCTQARLQDQVQGSKALQEEQAAAAEQQLSTMQAALDRASELLRNAMQVCAQHTRTYK